MPVTGPDHFAVFYGLPEAPSMYVLKRLPNWDPPTVLAPFVCKSPSLEEVRKNIPENYANTGVPDGPFMIEVWVHV